MNYTPAAASVQISGKKEVNTGAPSTRFTFQLLEGETVRDTQTVTGAGTFTFNTITYDEVGTHTYTVTEVRGNETGWTYDRTVYTVTVTVQAVNGELTASYKITKKLVSIALDRSEEETVIDSDNGKEPESPEMQHFRMERERAAEELEKKD